MKLLMCKNCGDIFSLSYEEKTCKCQNVKGKYIDNLNATYSGEYAIPIGFNNFDFGDAIYNQPFYGMGKRFEAFVIPKTCDTFVKTT